jgi:uncharacterized membrane protein YeaQ/YmgE (transglycosylase-associated protein family)
VAVHRAVRLLLRATGWVLTPLILIVAAAIGATIGLLIATPLSLSAGIAATLSCALAGAIVVLILWVRLLRRRPGIREALDLTPSGLPETPLTDPAMREHSE